MKAVKRLMKHGPKSYSVEQLYQRDLAIFAMVLAMKNKVDVGTPLSDEIFTQLWLTGLGIGDNGDAFRGFLIEAFLRQDIDLVNPHGATVITGNCIQKFTILYHAHLLKEILDNIKEPADQVPPKVYYSHRICTREEMSNLLRMERYSLARAASQEDKLEVKSLLHVVRQRWHELEEHTEKLANNWVDRVMTQWIHWNDVTPRIPEASLQEEVVRCCGPPQPKKVKRQRRRGEESESDDDEPNNPNEYSFDYLDELEGQALGQALSRGKEEVKTVSLKFPKLNKIIQLRIKDFAMPTAHALKVDQKFILRADRVPHVPACIDLLTRFNGEYPTDMCLAWLALGRSPPTPLSVPADKLQPGQSSGEHDFRQILLVTKRRKSLSETLHDSMPQEPSGDHTTCTSPMMKRKGGNTRHGERRNSMKSETPGLVKFISISTKSRRGDDQIHQGSSVQPRLGPGQSSQLRSGPSQSNQSRSGPSQSSQQRSGPGQSSQPGPATTWARTRQSTQVLVCTEALKKTTQERS
ncbi:hypothetical protein R1sor_005297 [Riccia sorocarpa]|uniref:Uncharacterized protein n=1 Tax=Riccia sorocarpa TaxID=122646 RepID=A0ABD3HNE1_9MARC